MSNFTYKNLTKLEPDFISIGIKNENNKNFKVISEKKKHKFILAKNKINSKESLSWKVKINKITGWMAFGLTEKEKLEKNQYKFCGFNNQSYSCFLVSSNKHLWNSNFQSQNNLFLEELSSYENGEEINFNFSADENILRFYYKGFQGALKNVVIEEKDLVPCFILIAKNDEIEVNYY